MARQASSQSQTATYEARAREVAQALDIEFFEDSFVTAKVNGGNVVITVKTDRSKETQEQEAPSYG